MTRLRPIAIAVGTRSILLAGWTALQACATAAPRHASHAPPSAADAAPPALPVNRDEPVASPRPDGPAEPQRELGSAGAPEEPAATSLPEVGDVRQLQAEYDIPLDVNEEVVAYVRLFQSPELRPSVVQWLSRLQRYGPRYREILREHGIPEDTVFLAMVESGFTRRARSRARAVGPWQFIAATARRYGLRCDAWVDERRDPEKAAAAAARFLRALYRETGDWRLAWAGYNAGPGWIRRARALGYEDFWEMARAPGVLPAETRKYVPKIMAAAIVAKHADALGFAPDEIPPSRWVEYEEVVVPRGTSLPALARAARVDVAALRDLNVELLRPRTPPRAYRLKVPAGKSRVFAANSAHLFRAPRGVARHRVERGDTLWSIARRAGVTVRQLARWNDIRDPRRHVLLPGAVITVSAVVAGPGGSPGDDG